MSQLPGNPFRSETPHQTSHGAITMHPLSPVTDAPTGVKLDEELIVTLEKSFAALAPHGRELTTCFYERLFLAYPRLRSMFPADMAAQEAKLLESLIVVIEGLRKPDETRGILQALGKRHAEKGVKPEHYHIVCDILVDTMADIAGPGQWSNSLDADWRRALSQISQLMLSGY